MGVEIMPAKSVAAGDKKIIRGVIVRVHRKPVPAGIKRPKIRRELFKEQ
jgi:hypothetical protein